MTQPAYSIVPALALCLLVSACAIPQPVVPSNAMTMPTQCVVPAVDMTPPVPYQVLETRCGAEAWCAGWQFPENHSLVYEQTFRACVARGMPVRATSVVVQPVPAPALQPAAPTPMSPPRPYRN